MPVALLPWGHPIYESPQLSIAERANPGLLSLFSGLNCARTSYVLLTERKIADKIQQGLSSQRIKVADTSGGCGAMYRCDSPALVLQQVHRSCGSPALVLEQVQQSCARHKQQAAAAPHSTGGSVYPTVMCGLMGSLRLPAVVQCWSDTDV
jgi:hypothetical protein